MAVRILLREGTAAEWAASNPVLGRGEAGVDPENQKIKIGDGSTAWNDLPDGLDINTAALADDPQSELNRVLSATYASLPYVQEIAYGTNLEATDATVATWVPDTSTLTGQAVAAEVSPKLDKDLPRVFVDAYTGTDSEKLAAAATDATAMGGLVELPQRILDVGAGFSMAGYSCGIVGRGARYNTGDGLTLSVIKASTQVGPVLDFTGFDWPAAYRGVFEFSGFAVEGNNAADATKANVGIELGVAAGPGSVVWRNIAVTRTGGPCLSGESVYLHEFENVRLIGPVSAAANDVPWVDFRNTSGCQFDLVLYAAGAGANVGAAGAVRFGSITNFGSANNHIKLRPENLQLGEGATILHLEGNGNQIQADLFDCHRVTGTTTASVVRLAKPPNDFGGNRVVGTIYGDNNNTTTGFYPGVDVLQSGNSIVGVKGYHGNNVRLASGVVRTYAELGGAEANAAGSAFVDDSGNSDNTLLDYVRFPRFGMDVSVGITPESKGAVGDGVTDDEAAINAAVASAATFNAPVLLTKTYATNGLIINSPVTFHGPGGFIHTGTAVNNWHAISVSGVKFHGVTFDGADLVNIFGVNVQPGLSDIEFLGCTFTRMGKGIGFKGTKNLRVARTAFTDIVDGVYVYDDATGELTGNTITNWTSRGIYLDGTTLGTQGLDITYNTILDMAPGGVPRHPIQVVGNGSAPHRNIRVNYNYVVGPGKSWTAVDPGTADQISLYYCVDFECIGNYSEGGGDMGITVSQTCKRGKVHDNICTYNDVAGITVGTTGSPVYDVSVKNNICFNNGQNRNADRVNIARTGLTIWEAHGCVVSGNITGDDQATKTQQYGLRIADCTNVVERDNLDEGNALGLLSWSNSTWGSKSPYAEAAGKTTGVVLTAGVVANITVTFPAGRFTKPPLVTPFIQGSVLTANPLNVDYTATNPDTATIYMRSPVDATVAVQWHAVQATP